MLEKERELFYKIKDILNSSSEENWVKLNPFIHRIKMKRNIFNCFFKKLDKTLKLDSVKLLFIENKMLGLLMDIEQTIFEKHFSWNYMFIPLFVNESYVPMISAKVIKTQDILSFKEGVDFMEHCSKLNSISERFGRFKFKKERSIMFDVCIEGIELKII
jgi:hypothetical protein